jgi:hypothetical protein
MSRLKDIAKLTGMAGALGGIGYGDLQATKYGIQKKLDAEKKADEKIEEMKRKEAPSGGGSGESTARPKVMKKGGFVRSADGCAVKGKTKGRMV